MLLAGIAKEKIFLCDSEKESIQLVNKQADDDVYLLYDTTSVELGQHIAQTIAESLGGQ